MVRYAVPATLTDRQWASLKRRLSAKVDKSAGPDGCWPYTGYRQSGYGRIMVVWGYITKASRAAYIMHTHTMLTDKSVSVCHRCDNPACCNPSHLFLGDQSANLADMRAKGRHNRGEKNGNAQITADQVLRIRAMVAGGKSKRRTAREAGLSESHVRKICSRKIWKHLS